VRPWPPERVLKAWYQNVARRSFSTSSRSLAGKKHDSSQRSTDNEGKGLPKAAAFDQAFKRGKLEDVRPVRPPIRPAISAKLRSAGLQARSLRVQCDGIDALAASYVGQGRRRARSERHRRL
jgi:hypothetical protein